VTQKPWNRIPVATRTLVLNPIVACLAGGRNKLVAAKAYEDLNREIAASGLALRVPETIRDVRKADVPAWVEAFGGQAVVKVPYSNAGQFVYTITRPSELAKFMADETEYDMYIVQSLIGKATWRESLTRARAGQLFHVGTVPDRANNVYVADMRVMVCATPDGFRPIGMYARRAERPLTEHLEDAKSSWSMLGTNLSTKEADGSWGSDTKRLLLMDRRDFGRLGVGIDQLIEGFVQTVLATIAIDRLATRLVVPESGDFDYDYFRTIDADPSLVREVEAGAVGRSTSSSSSPQQPS
jgi:hypothetical protein